MTWLGHATFKVTTSQNKVILIDPWIEGNPKSPAEARAARQGGCHSGHTWTFRSHQ